MILELRLDLHQRRCHVCNRWFATEREIDWKCGSCAGDAISRLQGEVSRLERSNSALRGALSRKGRRRRAA